jgi:gentisate 1,2-dioxygenase
MIAEPVVDGLTTEQFVETVRGEHLNPLWLAPRDGLKAPRTHVVPYLWRWQHIKKRMLQAGELVPIGVAAAERRVLTLQNPGNPKGVMGTTHTLIAAVQLVHGTEQAPSHRHTAAALRFIKEGKGACTVVNFEPESMDVGDLLLTPNWYWHGHFSEHEEPMLWMDGLDVPLVQWMGAMFQEEYPSANREQPMIAPRDESIRRYSGGGLLPFGERPSHRNSPLLNYRWAATEERLMALASRDGSPYDGIALEYTNPTTGGPVMPTIDCWIQMLRPGEQTQAHRHTGSVVYNVVRGNGYSVIEGQRFEWTPGDIFCVPAWAWHEHANTATEDDAVLFSMNDSPVFRALDLYREESLEDGNGHQPVTSNFAG